MNDMLKDMKARKNLFVSSFILQFVLSMYLFQVIVCCSSLVTVDNRKVRFSVFNLRKS